MLTQVSRLLLISLLAFPQQERSALQQGFALLLDPVQTAEGRARLVEISGRDPAAREELSSRLPGLLLTEKNIAVLQNEAKLAGELGLTSAIPALVHLLDSFNYDGNSGLSERYYLMNDPVARALFELGPASVPNLAEALKEGNRDAKLRAGQVLVLMKSPESQAVLSRQLRIDDDPHFRRFLIANGVKPLRDERKGP